MLPFTKVVRKAPRAPVPCTLGEHLRSRRRTLRLLQKDVAERIGVTEYTIHNWERGNSVPPIAFMPAIVRFLGYDPSPESVTLAERMHAYRKRHGLSIREAALRAGVDPSSWGQWERTGIVPWKRYRELLNKFLGG